MSEKILTVFLMRDGRYVKEEDYNELETELNEARAEIERKDQLIEQVRVALALALSEARSTHCEQTILAALAAERGE